jgi:hypothetical protein
MQKAIKQVGRMPVKDLFDEAETFVCAVCDLERKPCHIHAGATCAHKFRDGTELDLLREADRSYLAGVYGKCMMCGDTIPAAILGKEPLRELCPACMRASKRT